MAQRGRKAAASYVPVHRRPKFSGKRIEAPAELDAAQKAIFDKVANSLPADWFHTCNAQLLVEYAIQVDMRNHFVKRWHEARSANDLRVERELFKLLQSGAQLIERLARSMRLAQISVKHRETTTHKDVAAPKRVWGVGEAA